MKKSHNSICYHQVHKTQASEIIRVCWIQGEYKQSDLVINITLINKRRYELMNEIIWNDGFTILNFIVVFIQ